MRLGIILDEKKRKKTAQHSVQRTAGSLRPLKANQTPQQLSGLESLSTLAPRPPLTQTVRR